MGYSGLISFVLLSLFSSQLLAGETSIGCRKNSDLNICIKKKLNQIIPSLKDGWEEIGLMKLDPLSVPGLETGEEDRELSLTLTLRDTAFHGLAHSTVETVRSENLELGKIEVITRTPKLKCLGQYRAEGVVSTFPLQSEGGFNITLTDVRLAWMIYLDSYISQNEKHLNVDKLTLDAMPAQIYVTVSDTFDGDNRLGKAFNLYLNQNSFEIYYLVKPSLMKAFEELFRDIINTILSNVPEKDIFS